MVRLFAVQQVVQAFIRYFLFEMLFGWKLHSFGLERLTVGSLSHRLLIYTHNLFSSRLIHGQEVSGLFGPPGAYIHQDWLDGSSASVRYGFAITAGSITMTQWFIRT